MRGLVLVFCLAASTLASASEPKRSVVNFDGDQIDGDIVRPEGELVAARPELVLPSLVRAPDSFVRERRRDLMRAASQLGEGEANGR